MITAHEINLILLQEQRQREAEADFWIGQRKKATKRAAANYQEIERANHEIIRDTCSD